MDVPESHFKKWMPSFADNVKANIEVGDGGLASIIFALQNAANMAETRFTELVLSAIGADPDDPDTWPFDWDNTRFDDYDGSFEFKGVTPVTWEMTLEQWEQIKQLGFARCWICYKDNTEIFYGQGKSERRQCRWSSSK